ncbi:hypothetical protein PWT90_08204 [Aphanocladium album]|nr:hypothetical protein PWT90_08204 [Aphanocladium album]
MTSPCLFLDPNNYRVAWFAFLEIEAKAAQLMLDRRHDGIFPEPENYCYRCYADHSIRYGTHIAHQVVNEAQKVFRKLEVRIVVGICAGVPSLPNDAQIRDIRLGDVLVAQATERQQDAVVYCELRKETDDGVCEIIPNPNANRLDARVQRSVNALQSQLAEKGCRIFLQHVTAAMMIDFADPGLEKDCFRRHEDNAGGQDIGAQRPTRDRSNRTQVFYGPIASGNAVVKNSKTRDKLARDHGIIGIEMEVAGMMYATNVSVIRGVSDYADGNKNDLWHPYAAITAASYAKEVLRDIGSLCRDTPSTTQPRTLPENTIASSERPMRRSQARISVGVLPHRPKVHIIAVSGCQEARFELPGRGDDDTISLDGRLRDTVPGLDLNITHYAGGEAEPTGGLNRAAVGSFQDRVISMMKTNDDLFIFLARGQGQLMVMQALYLISEALDSSPLIRRIQGIFFFGPPPDHGGEASECCEKFFCILANFRVYNCCEMILSPVGALGDDQDLSAANLYARVRTTPAHPPAPGPPEPDKAEKMFTKVREASCTDTLFAQGMADRSLALARIVRLQHSKAGPAERRLGLKYAEERLRAAQGVFETEKQNLSYCDTIIDNLRVEFLKLTVEHGSGKIPREKLVDIRDRLISPWPQNLKLPAIPENMKNRIQSIENELIKKLSCR